MPGETVIVNFLPNSLDNNDLRNLFHSVGTIVQSHVVRNIATGQSRCFGFITFSNAEEANRAVRILNGRRVQDKTIKVSISVSSEEMANSAKLYVSGLPIIWSDKDLSQQFEKFGKILSSRVLIEQTTGVSRGVGFVTFENFNDAQCAIDQLNGCKPDGEAIPLKVLFAKKQDDLVPGSANLETVAQNSVDMDPACNVMVNFLPESWGDNELRQLFSSIGPISRLKVINDKVTGNSKCYGFVLFQNAEDAQRACKCLNGRLVQNKSIRVAMAVREEDGKLYIGNFPLNWTDIELTSLLDPFGIVVSARVLFDKQTGLPRGCGFAAMETREQAQLAIDQLAGTKVHGSHQPLKIHFPVDSKSKEVCRAGSFNIVSNVDIIGGSSAAKKRRFDGSNIFDQIRSVPTCLDSLVKPSYGAHHFSSLNASIPSTNHAVKSSTFGVVPPPGYSGDQCIFVHGLDERIDDIELWQLFGPFGAVKNVRVIRTKDVCQGYGFVTMVHYHEACEAISQLNGRTYAKKMLQVRFKGHEGDSVSGSANGNVSMRF